jgi:3-hydroxybutyrate dehydrogenase
MRAHGKEWFRWNTKPDAIDGMIAQAIRDLGGVDILVNNAGIQHTAPVREFPVERWNAITAINISAAFYAMRAVLPSMESRGWGRIINIASLMGSSRRPTRPAMSRQSTACSG